MPVKVDAVIQLKVNMVEKFTSEIFIPDFVAMSSYNWEGAFTLVHFLNLPCSVWV